MTIKIINGKVITDHIVEKNVYIRNGVIQAITNGELPYEQLIDAKGNYVSPGFIDVHVHGGGGADFMDGGINPVMQAARAHMKHGTTTIIPTTLSDELHEISKTVHNIKSASEKTDMPHIIGVHLEGPWISKSQAGAMNPKYIIAPTRRDYESLISECGDFVCKVSFAPELEGADELCEYLKDNSIVASAGHTDATMDDIQRCRAKGLGMFTHLYSAMSSITRREGYRVLGAVESAYYYDDMYVEVIADGIHLPPDLLRLIYKIKGPEKICLITDAMRGADMPEGDSILGSLKNDFKCVIEDGIAKMPDRTCFAGSVATADRCVRVYYKLVGVPLEKAVQMMTKTPAIVHGIQQKGEIKEGYDADLIIFDDDIQIEKVILKAGRDVKIYGKE